jgi:hypothetical protein
VGGLVHRYVGCKIVSGRPTGGGWGRTRNVKFETYVHQTTIFRGGIR